jgi:hypothetical protein
MAGAVSAMSDHDEHGHENHDDHDDHSEHSSEEGLERVTSPMQQFSSREVGIGTLILAVGLLVTFGIPLALG